MELVGTPRRSADGFLIITNNGEFSIAYQPMAPNHVEMVDNRVKVTATLVEGAERQDGIHVIEVNRFVRDRRIKVNRCGGFIRRIAQ